MGEAEGGRRSGLWALVRLWCTHVGEAMSALAGERAGSVVGMKRGACVETTIRPQQAMAIKRLSHARMGSAFVLAVAVPP
jgi:hypothetical protein